jgi:hypothetical protein
LPLIRVESTDRVPNAEVDCCVMMALASTNAQFFDRLDGHG